MNQFFAPTMVQYANGRDGAMAFDLPRNSSILLMDTSEPIIWLKVTDANGKPDVTGYAIKELPKPEDVIKSLEERIAELESRLNNESYDGQTESTNGGNDGNSESA